jgi:putative effector of murein hydrolase LrgA (UPF0299 family)
MLLSKFIISLAMILIFTPLGVFTLITAYSINNPQVFVMVIFSGSLMVLLGLTGMLGAWFGRPGRKEKENIENIENIERSDDI